MQAHRLELQYQAILDTIQGNWIDDEGYRQIEYTKGMLRFQELAQDVPTQSRL